MGCPPKRGFLGGVLFMHVRALMTEDEGTTERQSASPITLSTDDAIL